MATRLAESLKGTDRTRERIHWIDLFRGLAVFLLLAGHAVVLISRSAPPWLARDLQLSLDICIPMFMVVSGMTMWHLVCGRRCDLSRTAWR